VMIDTRRGGEADQQRSDVAPRYLLNRPATVRSIPRPGVIAHCKDLERDELRIVHAKLPALHPPTQDSPHQQGTGIARRRYRLLRGAVRETHYLPQERDGRRPVVTMRLQQRVDDPASWLDGVGKLAST